ncbi:KRAB-A domain-containing protein 2-like [Metopolophium dirhodum]|uniref:KRAB-A domain-containing protein 2-like n=1 Tax=Metopolophium dirhodum TaxID=44670 RepID=UPI00298FAA1F|nr:KRAB-A domain-containing protein 2-like [Metopolophium dirhodum]
MQAQPDKNFKFILVYQDHLTKFVLLRPLTHKRAENVACVLLDIFTTFGAPSILHSNNGREFVSTIMSDLCNMWPGLKIVHGKQRHSQSQGSVERVNQDIENMIATWLQDNNTRRWSEGLKFIQFMKNRCLHHVIKCSPYEAMFGTQAKVKLATSSLPKNFAFILKKEEDLEEGLKKTVVCPIGDGNVNINNEVNEVQDKIISDDISTKIKSIDQKRSSLFQNLQKQATKMKGASGNRFCKGKIGDNVIIRIPNVDRARCGHRNILSVILSVKDNLYEIGTKEGKINQMFCRNQFKLYKESLITTDEVPENIILLREVA